MKNIRRAFCFLALTTTFSFAQNQGKIKVEGYTVHMDKKGKKSSLPDLKITVYKGADKTDEYKSDKKGKYNLELAYGSTYKIALEGNDGYMDVCYSILGKIPDANQNINCGINVDFIVIDKDNPDIDSLKFKFPFTRLKFDGNKKFVDDEKYLNDFAKGMFKEYVEAKKQLKKEQAEKLQEEKTNAGIHFIKIGGKLMAGDPPSIPLANMKVLLKDDKGKILETSTTDKYGKFIFLRLPPDQNFSIVMDENDSSKFSEKKITMYNKYGKELLVSTSDKKGGFKFQLLSSDKTTLSKLIVEDNNLLIAGTLEGMINGKSLGLAKARIALTNSSTGEVYEIVETDENGKFVFAMLPQDKNFIIRMAEASPEFANLKISIKDRKGNEIASGATDGFGKFRFQLLSSDKEMLNNIEVEENDLKVDLIGKFINGTTNNPLSSFKVDLLDDNGKILQSTTTDEKGRFKFANLTLYAGYFFKLDENNPKVTSLSSLILAETSEKPIKEYKIEEGKEVKHRILASDQRKLGRLYLK